MCAHIALHIAHRDGKVRQHWQLTQKLHKRCWLPGYTHVDGKAEGGKVVQRFLSLSLEMRTQSSMYLNDVQRERYCLELLQRACLLQHDGYVAAASSAGHMGNNANLEEPQFWRILDSKSCSGALPKSEATERGRLDVEAFCWIQSGRSGTTAQEVAPAHGQALQQPDRLGQVRHREPALREAQRTEGGAAPTAVRELRGDVDEPNRQRGEHVAEGTARRGRRGTG